MAKSVPLDVGRLWRSSPRDIARSEACVLEMSLLMHVFHFVWRVPAFTEVIKSPDVSSLSFPQGFSSVDVVTRGQDYFYSFHRQAANSTTHIPALPASAERVGRTKNRRAGRHRKAV